MKESVDQADMVLSFTRYTGKRNCFNVVQLYKQKWNNLATNIQQCRIWKIVFSNKMLLLTIFYVVVILIFLYFPL
jgi:hypothetical protein